MTRTERIAALHQAAKKRILVLDGSWGVMIQRRGLDEADFRADRFVAANGYDEKHQMKGNNDILCITRPDVIADLHDQYFAAGADISETNTFSGTTIAQEELRPGRPGGEGHQFGRRQTDPRRRRPLDREGAAQTAFRSRLHRPAEQDAVHVVRRERPRRPQRDLRSGL